MKSAHHHDTRLLLSRAIGLAACALGLNYIIWRYTSSLNMQALWFAIPMVIAETYGIVDMLLFVFMSWRKPKRDTLPSPEKADVDIFITTYNEPEELVATTAKAALRIDWPDKKVYILDDGARESMKKTAEEIGCGYISRGEEWTEKPRHAKAGNVNNALLETSGEFILILDADQIPAPAILRKTLGFFADPALAFVQTPQYFYNLPPGDPFGNEASLFYGPIQQGKDGWNAAFFCGSNAVLRREALMQLGIREYVETVEKREREMVDKLTKRVKKTSCDDEETCAAVKRLTEGLKAAREALDDQAPLEHVSDLVIEAVRDAEFLVSKKEVGEIAGAMNELAESGDAEAAAVYRHIIGNLDSIARKTPPSFEALRDSEEYVEALNLARSDEAVPVQALATISITEDMATAMRLHSLGWKSVFYPEVLAYGLAPEDLGTSLKQRLRWAQGTVQVFVRENPLFKKGLSLPQKMMYFATMYSYFSGFFNLVLLLAPIIYFFTGIAPVNSWSTDFFVRFIPFFVMNKIMFRFVASGIPVWRGEQYNLAMFPLNIRAVLSVLSGKKLGFVVTPKQKEGGHDFRLIWPQTTVIVLTIAAATYGIIEFFLGRGIPPVGLAVNLTWSIYNIISLAVVVKALYYQPPDGWSAQLPEFARGDARSGHAPSSDMPALDDAGKPDSAGDPGAEKKS
ncbi:putative glycosyltransferase [uncultured spirochete]|jgi:cellulose synthase (UDP-forming)|uniref:Putative glycosyltransferase n=1 Tax=uncultured spirochete TaxID=156406 RepID=A0A3P3XQQ2_9SPIR|nr:putative glycosyltransferase [uncultured spirochete]